MPFIFNKILAIYLFEGQLFLSSIPLLRQPPDIRVFAFCSVTRCVFHKHQGQFHPRLLLRAFRSQLSFVFRVRGAMFYVLAMDPARSKEL